MRSRKWNWNSIVMSWIVALLGVASVTASAGDIGAPPRTVLFICEHGNVKSLMAATYFNQAAREKKLPFVAAARGIAPDSTTVPSAIADGLRRQGFDVSTFQPIKVTAGDIAAASRTVAIGLTASAAPGSANAAMESWDDVPPASVDFGAASRAIRSHVDTLIARLSASHH